MYCRKDYKGYSKLIIIVKMDVEGFECEVIGGSKSLLGTNNAEFFMPYLFLEWMNLNTGRKSGRAVHCEGNTLANTLLDAGYM